MEKNNNAGVYAIRCIVNQKCYVGSSIRLPIRWARHRKELSKQIHDNSHLQNAWNKYGAEQFEFSVLEYFNPNTQNQFELEQKWIDYHRSADRAYGYNHCPAAGSAHGIGEGASNAKLTEKEVLEILKLYENGIHHDEIAQKYKVGTPNIISILKGNTWKHIPRTIKWQQPRKYHGIPSEEKAKELLNIVELLKNSPKEESIKSFAKKLGMNEKTISCINRGVMWQDFLESVGIVFPIKSRGIARKPRSKNTLTQEKLEKVIAIAKAIHSGRVFSQISKEFNVSQSTVSCINLGYMYSELFENNQEFPLIGDKPEKKPASKLLLKQGFAEQSAVNENMANWHKEIKAQIESNGLAPQQSSPNPMPSPSHSDIAQQLSIKLQEALKLTEQYGQTTGNDVSVWTQQLRAMAQTANSQGL